MLLVGAAAAQEGDEEVVLRTPEVARLQPAVPHRGLKALLNHLDIEFGGVVAAQTEHQGARLPDLAAFSGQTQEAHRVSVAGGIDHFTRLDPPADALAHGVDVPALLFGLDADQDLVEVEFDAGIEAGLLGDQRVDRRVEVDVVAGTRRIGRREVGPGGVVERFGRFDQLPADARDDPALGAVEIGRRADATGGHRPAELPGHLNDGGAHTGTRRL